jgi:hypothetical protein
MMLATTHRAGREHRNVCFQALSFRSLVLSLVLLALVACSPTFPTTPTEDPTSVVIHYYSPFWSPLQTNNNFVVNLRAFAIAPGDVYYDVTKDVQWTISDPTVMRPFDQIGSLARFAAVRPGFSFVTATYQGKSASEPFFVDVTPSPVSYLEIRFAGGVSLEFPTGQARVVYRDRLSPGSFRDTDVSAEAQWRSSNPAVATVEGGSITAVGPGTTEITAVARGLSAFVRVSVTPRSKLP